MKEINESNNNNEPTRKPKKLPPAQSPKKLGKLPLNPTPQSLAWSPEKHDLKVTQFKEGEAKKRAMEIIGQHYLSWKRGLERRVKKGAVKTTQDLISAIYELHGAVGKAVAHTPGMSEWRTFSLAMLEDKVSLLIRTEAGTKNEIVEYLPGSLLRDPHRVVVPETHQFETWEEFNAIPYVKRFTSNVDFVGFFSSGKFVKALYRDGEAVEVGIVLSAKGLENIPTHKELVDNLPPLPEDAP